ncbi:general secretion pathway protein D [Oxalobacteraceae bacterium GrIS 1.18]
MFIHSENKKKAAMPLFHFLRTRLRCAVGVAVIAPLLCSCVAQRTFNEGKDLVSQDKVEVGLQKMQEASKRDPHDVEFKTTYYRERDNAISGYLEEADRDIAAGRLLDAENLFNRVLAMDVGNVRAMDGLKHIQIEEHHQTLLTEAGQQFKSGGVDGAKLKMAIVLAENPSNEKALKLQREINEKTVRPTNAEKLASVYKKPITLQFKDASLKQIFEVISETSGLNFIFDKDVKTDQKTSIFLKNSTIENALYFTLLTNQLDQEIMDANTVLIYPNSLAKQKDYQEMVVKSFFLTNADAKAVAATLKSIIKTKDVVVDEKLNMIIMRDTPQAIKLAEKLVVLHDIAEPEVMLDVAVLEVKRTKLQDLGIQWPSGLTLTPVAPLGTSNIPNGALALNQLLHIQSSNVGVGNPTAQVNARSTDSDANLLANPRIRTRNHEKAKIMIGDRVPNITVNTSPSTTTFITETITYVDVGLKLEVEPTVYLDNEVAIKINLEVSNIVSQLVTKSGSVAYQIGTRNAASVLVLKDGETQVLAGLLDDEERHTINKIPSLGDIPILGHLFGSTNDDIQKTEIILSITPHLIRNIRRPDFNATQFSSGTENNFKPRPDVTGATDAAMLSVGQRASPSARKAAAQQNVALPTGSADNSGAVTTPPVPTPIAPVFVPQADANSGAEPGDRDVPAPNAAPPDPAAQAPGAMSLSLNSAASTRVGRNIVLKLNAQSDEALSNLPVAIGFDSAIFQVVNVTEGDFLQQGGAQSSFNSQIDTNGQVLITGAASGGSGAASGTVATITLKALAPTGGSVIQVLSAAPLSVSGRAVNAGLAANNSVATTVRVEN